MKLYHYDAPKNQAFKKGIKTSTYFCPLNKLVTMYQFSLVAEYQGQRDRPYGDLEAMRIGQMFMMEEITESKRCVHPLSSPLVTSEQLQNEEHSSTHTYMTPQKYRINLQEHWFSDTHFFGSQLKKWSLSYHSWLKRGLKKGKQLPLRIYDKLLCQQ